VIILDGSALVELILHTPTGHLVAARIADPAEGLHVLHLADVEVVKALRRCVREGDIGAEAAAVALDDSVPWTCSATHMSHYLSVCGNCVRISPRTTPSTSRWRKSSTASY
jgi:hypothetical protein